MVETVFELFLEYVFYLAILIIEFFIEIVGWLISIIRKKLSPIFNRAPQRWKRLNEKHQNKLKEMRDKKKQKIEYCLLRKRSVSGVKRVIILILKILGAIIIFIITYLILKVQTWMDLSHNLVIAFSGLMAIISYLWGFKKVIDYFDFIDM